jgi:hypothetical protein
MSKKNIFSDQLFSERVLKAILLIAGLITSSMLLITIAPNVLFPLFFGLEIDFGSEIGTPLLEFVVRSWSFLIFLIGAALIFAVFDARFRLPICLLAGISKLFFAGLIISYRDLVLSGFMSTLIIDAIFGLLLITIAWQLQKQSAEKINSPV